MAARKKPTAQPIGQEAAAPPPAQEPPPPAAAEGDVNPFPKIIRTANFGGYKVFLDQNQAANEMRIQFGSGQRADKPSDAVLDIIRAQRVPDELLTVQERSEGKPVPWFKFKGDPETGEGSWRMWMRNRPNAARTKAEQVFDMVVTRLAAELDAGRGR
jgi:hypothetical protein